MEFKVGDKVEIKEGFAKCYKCSVSSDFRGKAGDRGFICGSYEGMGNIAEVNFEKDVGGHNCNGHCPPYFGQRFCEEHLELISSKNIMTKLNSMMKRLLDADTRKLIKAGLIDGDLKLTVEGGEVLDAILFDQNKAELVKAADEILAEEKETK